jgi:plastocyanin domain-containing protein
LSEIAIPSLKRKKALPLKVPVGIPFTPTRSGEVTFACGMDMYRGTLLVE